MFRGGGQQFNPRFPVCTAKKHVLLHTRSTAVTQKFMEHSSPDLTNKVYTNVDPVLRHAVDTMPVGDWLQLQVNNLSESLLAKFCVIIIEAALSILIETAIPVIRWVSNPKAFIIRYLSQIQQRYQGYGPCSQCRAMIAKSCMSTH